MSDEDFGVAKILIDYFKNNKIRRRDKLKNLFKDAKFKHKICGELCVELPIVYIVDVRNYAGNKSVLGIFLSAYIDQVSFHYQKGKVYINKCSMELILQEIKYFVQNKVWRTPYDKKA